MTTPVVPLRAAGDGTSAAAEALAAVSRHLDRCKLAARTVRAYERQSAAYAGWLAAHAADHGDASPTWSAPREPSLPGSGT